MKKTPTGVGFFDVRCGGIPSGRAMLMTGHRGAGKTLLALQFLRRGLELDEPALILSARSRHELALAFKKIGIDADRETRRNRLFILNYGDIIGDADLEQDIMLPPEGFLELKDLIERQGIQRVALDTVLPWMNLTTKGHLAEHVFSFVRAFERMKTTALFTLFEPVSPAARKLHTLLEDAVPVSISIDYDPAAGTRYWVVNKYEGENHEPWSRRRIKIDPKIGVVPLPEENAAVAVPSITTEEILKMDDQDVAPRVFPDAEPAKQEAPEVSSSTTAAASLAEKEKENMAIDDENLVLRAETQENAPPSESYRTPFARAMFNSGN